MSSKSRLSGQELRAFRSDISKLKAKGLVSARVDARSQKPTRHMLAQVKRFKPVLEGKAQVITAPRAVAKEYENIWQRKGRKLVVPIGKTEHARFDPKTKKVKVYGKTPQGQRYVKADILDANTAQPSAFPQGNNVYYRMPFGGGKSFTFDNLKDLFDFMRPYEANTRPYLNWQSYVEIIRLNPNRVLPRRAA